MNTNTYRAAFWISADGGGELVLTGPEHAHFSKMGLLMEARRYARENGIGIAGGEMRIGTWTE